MNQKKFVIIILVVIIVAITVGGYFILIKRQGQIPLKIQSLILTLKDSKSVCRYVHQNAKHLIIEGTKIPVERCNNYDCSADDKGEYWYVLYRCPGPPNFPMGQGYSIEVNKTTGSIRVTGMTN